MSTKQELEQENLNALKKILDRAKRAIDDYETMRSLVEQRIKETGGYVLLFNINEDIRGLLSLTSFNFHLINREVTESIQQLGEEIKFRLSKSIRDVRHAMKELGEVRERIDKAQEIVVSYQKELDQSLLERKLTEEKKAEIVSDLKKYFTSNRVDIVNIRIGDDLLEGSEIEGNFNPEYDIDFSSDSGNDFLSEIENEVSSDDYSISELKGLLEERFGNRNFWATVCYQNTIKDIKRLPSFEGFTETEKDAFLDETEFHIGTVITDKLLKEIADLFEL